MYEHTYDLMLDSYGYLLGIENVTDNTNSFFIVGYTQRDVNWGDAIDDALVIFPDGTMDEVKTMERKDFKLPNDDEMVPDSEIVNAWYDYSINADGVYEIHGLSENQFMTNAEDTIDSSHDTLNATYRVDLGNGNAVNYVYGGDDSVYITVEKDNANRIDEVSSVTTGLRNANINVDAADQVSSDSAPNGWVGTVFGLFDDDGYVTYAVVIGEDGANDYVYLVSGIEEAEQRGSVTYYGYDAILPGSDEITRVWTENLTTAYDANSRRNVQLAAHNLYDATYDADGNITAMELLDNTAAGGFNTDSYEDAGYAMITVTANGNPQEFIENGTRTLRFPDDADNNRYILLAPDCLFFVNGEDDNDGDYDLYYSMNAALTALGTNAAGQHMLTADGGFARFVALTDANGQATTIIFYDREYEDVGDVGGGNADRNGTATITGATNAMTITGTYTNVLATPERGTATIEIFVRSNVNDEWVSFTTVEEDCYLSDNGQYNINAGQAFAVGGLVPNTSYYVQITLNTESVVDLVVYDGTFAFAAN